MTDHNGWTNDATSRVYNDIFKNIDPYDDIPDEQGLWPQTGLTVFVAAIKDFAEDLIFDARRDESNYAYDYARAFLSEVNWFEIAERLFLAYADAEDLEEYIKELEKTDET